MDTAFRAEIVTNLLGLKDYMFLFQKICLGIVLCVFQIIRVKQALNLVFPYQVSGIWL